ncbi:hypothetical protein ABH924_003351 [Arthrobacter sp. GAS37]|uniref:hypothetical protein n=1 Tax=Arthrobacter sp. GAS37 TaxID=3156261 RepID=UPI00383386DB
MLIFRMGREKLLPANDKLGRIYMGYRDGLTQQECWDRTRGLWKLDESRALVQEEAAIVDPDWTVRAVARITGITKHGEFRAVEGDVIVNHPLVGTAWPTPSTSRNSISYQ